MLQLRENWRKRCSHTKEFWVRKGQCALPHVDVLRPKGLTPEILLGPCCLSATREAVITPMVHSKNHNDFSWVLRSIKRTLEINLNFRPHRHTTLEGSSDQLQKTQILTPQLQSWPQPLRPFKLRFTEQCSLFFFWHLQNQSLTFTISV